MESILIATLRGLAANPTFGNQTELIRLALAEAEKCEATNMSLSTQCSDLAQENLKLTYQLELAKQKDEKTSAALAAAGTHLAMLEEESSAMDAALARLENGLDILPFAIECHSNSVAHGWWDESVVGKRTFGDVVALLHSEVSEALEAFREPGDFRNRLFHIAAGGKPEGRKKIAHRFIGGICWEMKKKSRQGRKRMAFLSSLPGLSVGFFGVVSHR